MAEQEAQAQQTSQSSGAGEDVRGGETRSRLPIDQSSLEQIVE
jgi:hypothetical protein